MYRDAQETDVSKLFIWDIYFDHLVLITLSEIVLRYSPSSPER
jgi:hypothetical protein